MKNNLIISALFFFSATTQAANPERQTGFDPASDIIDSDRNFASSPTVVDLNNDGSPEIIFGDSKGKIHAISSNGNVLWQHSTGSASIESKPAVADINNDGSLEVVVSSGSTRTPGDIGSLSVLNGQTGIQICQYFPPQFSTAPRAVYSTPAIANLDDDPQLEIVIGDFGANVTAFNHDCSVLWKSQSPPTPGNLLPEGYDENSSAFQVYVNDTVWSSPAIADINNDGQLDVIIGVDSHVDDNGITPDGGRLLVINGNNGTKQLAINTDEVIWASPVIADLDKDGNLDIIVGTGYCWQATNGCAPGSTHAVNNKIYAWNNQGQNILGWPHVLQNNYATRNNSPAVADIDGDGSLEVIVNTFLIGSGTPPFIPDSGKVFAINHDATLLWGTIPNVPAGAGFTHFSSGSASPIIADISGNGDYDVVVPSNFELIVYNKNGAQISRQDPNPVNDLTMLGELAFIGTPTMADLDNDGDYEIIGVSGNRNITPRPATIHVWDLDTPTNEFQPWLSFRNGKRNTGVYVDDIIFNNSFE